MKLSLFLVVATLSFVCGHVTITPASVPAGGSTVINFQLSHGCNASTLTNRVYISFPANLSTSTIKPVDKAGWILTRNPIPLGYKINGIDQYSLDVTWEVNTTMYQGLPDWAFDVMQVRISAAATIAPGTKFFVPVWQGCTMGLSYAWNQTTKVEGEGMYIGNGITQSACPSFSVLAPTDIQFIPSQANVKTIADQVTALTTTVASLTNGATNTGGNTNTTSAPTTAAPVSNAGTTTMNYFEDSSSWRKADTVSVIAIILAAISILVSVILTIKIATVEKQNTMLSK